MNPIIDENGETPERIASESKASYRESYHDSYYFEELSSYEPMDWINIPKPLQLALITMKKCIISNNRQVSDVSEKIHQITTRYKKKLEGLEDSVVAFGTTINEGQVATAAIIEDGRAKTEEALIGFRIQMNKDLDFKQKSTDGKLAYFDEQLFGVRKFVNSLPTADEIKKNTRDNVEIMREEIRNEINELYLQPAVEGVSKLIEQVKDSQASFRLEFEASQSIFSKQLTDIIASNSQSYQKAADSINYAQELLRQQIKSSEEIFSLKLERHAKGIDALNTSFHDINHKLYTECKALQKEIDTQKLNQTILQEELATIKIELDGSDSKEILHNSSSSYIALPTSPLPSHSPLSHPPPSPKNPQVESLAPSEQLRSAEPATKIKISDPASSKRGALQTKPKEPSKSKSKSSKADAKQLEELTSKFNKLQKYLESRLDLSEERLNREINSNILPLEKKLKESLSNNAVDLTEIKEKLAWLPMNFSQIRGKSPSEARLFIIEARIRSEENSRIQSFNRIMSYINSFQSSTSPLPDDFTLPPIRTLSVTHERTYSQDSGLISESIRKNTESELSKKEQFTYVSNSPHDFLQGSKAHRSRALRKTQRNFKQESFLSRNN